MHGASKAPACFLLRVTSHPLGALPQGSFSPEDTPINPYPSYKQRPDSSAETIHKIPSSDPVLKHPHAVLLDSQVNVILLAVGSGSLF